MSKELTKTVKVPVYIDEPDEQLKKIKYRAIERIMEESRFLGNIGIRYSIAYDMLKMPTGENGTPGPCSRTAIYRRMGEQRKFLPSSCMGTLGERAYRLFKASTKWNRPGGSRLPTYSSKFIIFRHTNTHIKPVDVDGEKQFVIIPDGFHRSWLTQELISEVNKNGPQIALQKGQEKLRFISWFSWKDHGARAIVQRLVDKDYTLADGAIEPDKEKGFVLSLVYKFTPIKPELDPDRVCGVDLGVVIPAYCATNFSSRRLRLGFEREVESARAKFRAQRRREQKRMGLRSNTKKWTPTESEKNWIGSYYNKLSAKIVKFCIDNGCGTIHMEDLTASKQPDSHFAKVLRGMAPGKLHTLLTTKAAEAGITVVKINPRNTSRRCSECGYTSPGNRKDQRHFVCEKCGDPAHPSNADYNAAKNIALASGNVLQRGYQDSPQASEQGGKLRRRREAKSRVDAADFTAGGR